MAREDYILLKELAKKLSPELFSQVQGQLNPEGLVSDNQNQNQNKGEMEEFAQMKPAVLREIALGGPDLGDETVMDNQNQNQGGVQAVDDFKPPLPDPGPIETK